MRPLDVLMIEAVAEGGPGSDERSRNGTTPVPEYASLRRTGLIVPMSSPSEPLHEQLPPSLAGRQQLAARISELGEWFHNLNLAGVPTAPHHFLGDFPSIKWKKIADAIPQDLT